MKAWCVTVSKDDPRDWWYVRADSATHAKQVARDHDPGETMRFTDWIDIRARRVPELDESLNEARLMDLGRMCRVWEGEVLIPDTREQTCILLCADY